jgi:RNA recognition motif. (a.k.a. RRM, RBD, or RNP domain)
LVLLIAMPEAAAVASKPARLHVGGLPRHVTAAEVQDLFSRAIANDHLTGLEFMRDASTGLPRGFAYIGLSDAADAEAAVRALNGTRWKGSKLTVALAKEGYMARLQHEWAERSAAASAPPAVPAVTPIGLAKLIKKGLPPRILRIRKRPGQPPLLVDPVPQPGMKDMSSQEDAIAVSQRKRKKAVDVVFRAKRLVRFDSAAHRGPPCKSIPQLWRDATSSSSDSTGGMAAADDVQDADAAAWQGLADLAPEETGGEEAMSFVWDADSGHQDGASTDNEDNDAAADGTDTVLYHSDSDAENSQQTKKQRSSAGAGADEWTKERALASMADSSVQLVDSLVVDKLAKFRKQPDADDISSSSTAQRGALNKLRFTEGSRRRFAMDERFIDSSSDEDEDSKAAAAAAAQSYYDYEADTAVGSSSSSASSSSAAATGAAAAAAASECDLDAETARSMAVLAAMFGGSVGDTSKPAPKRAAAFVPQVRFDPSTMVGAKQAKPAAAAVNAVAAKPAVTNDRAASAAAAAAARNEVAATAAGASTEAAAGGRVAVPALSSERFVTSLSSLTDIFKVQDKASTKMSEQEKERATGFKVSSLFSSDAAEQPAAASSGAAPSDSAFSFGFDDSADASEELPAAAAAAVTLPHDSEVDAALRDLDSAASAKAEVQQIEVRGLWSSMDSVRQGAALFCRQESEAAIEEQWLHSRRNLTADFKRKHKTALKNKGAAPVLQKRRRVF